MYRIGSISNFYRWFARTRRYTTRSDQESRIKFLASRKEPVPQDDEGPLSYLKSPASTYRAESTRRGNPSVRLWYEPYVILGSVSVFLVYFAYLREENDIDMELSRSLYERLPGLEEMQLNTSLVYERNRGRDTTAIKRRLEEIRLEKERQLRDEERYD